MASGFGTGWYNTEGSGHEKWKVGASVVVVKGNEREHGPVLVTAVLPGPSVCLSWAFWIQQESLDPCTDLCLL